MKRALVIEDDRAIAELVQLYLRQDGFQVDIIVNGTQALHWVERNHDDLTVIVLDLMLPGLDGRGVCRRIRAFTDVPIIMLTALDDVRDKIEGFNLGADDYLAKPFNPAELMARISAILRRAERPAITPSDSKAVIVLGNTRIDREAHRILVDNVELPLRAKEFTLLLLLADHPNMALSRHQLLDDVWGGEPLGDSRTVDVHVSRLRNRLAASGANISIETVRSIGYRLSAR